ncbi:hypothetical protein D9M69_488830 [compost metagenome]
MVLASRTFDSCNTSPSAMMRVACERIFITGIEPSSTIISNEREYRKSPTSTLGALPHMALAVERPRRMPDMSTTSSWSRVAVCRNSMVVANRRSSSPSRPRALPHSSTNKGRRRLPPAEVM